MIAAEELAPAWRVAGSYFEACSCEPVCPCRTIGGRKGGRSTYGICDFALFWQIEDGRAGAVALSGLRVALAGSYDDDEPGSPWRVVLYVDERAGDAQAEALTAIFLGRAGGTSMRNFARLIGEVYAVRRTRVEIDPAARRQRGRAGDAVTLRIADRFDVGERVSCGIPGHDHPGEELRTELLRVDDPPLRWELRGRCGFATDFDYRSDEEG